MWSAFSDERAGLSFTAVMVSSTRYIYVFTNLHVSILHKLVVKSPVPCGYVLFTVVHVALTIYIYMCVCVYVCKIYNPVHTEG
jgi:hypothetical protein